MENKKSSPSWGIIAICFIVFWPVGIYLIYKKMSNDKAAALTNSKILKWIGYFFLLGAVVFLIELISGTSDTSSSVSVILFYGIGGALILYASKRVKASGEKYKQYIDIVINQEQRTIENIASQMNLSYDETVKDLQKMIDKGYFTGAFINQEEHEIKFLNQSNQNMAVKIETTPQSRVCKCPNCGGNNVVRAGQISECEFCGSPIK